MAANLWCWQGDFVRKGVQTLKAFYCKQGPQIKCKMYQLPRKYIFICYCVEKSAILKRICILQSLS